MVDQNNQFRAVRTEDPVKEIWSRLGYFESKYNCKQFLESKFPNSDEDLIETANNLAYSMSSAKEYYEAAERVTILTRPLLIFYGMTLLSKIVFIATHGKKSPSSSHGLQKVKEWNCAFPELSVEIGKDGTFPQFHGCFCNESLLHLKLSVKELLSLIPEVKTEFETVFGEKSRALKILRERRGIALVDTELDKYGDLESFFNRIPALQDRYMMKSFQRMPERINLWERSSQVANPAVRSISGEEYIILPLERNGKILTIPEMSSHFLIMYLLGMLSRYQPEEWGKTIRGEASGEIYLVQKLLEITKRKFPNLILNNLHGRDFVFIGPQVESENEINLTQKEEIAEFVKGKIFENIGMGQ
jgi:hypothetical protein